MLLNEGERMKKEVQLPIIVERDEDNFYVVECPVFSGCYTQGRTIDEALKNIKEVIELCLEEKENKEALKNFHPQEMSFHTLTYA
jgi:predicted RNase H-like HicB family nuclease